MKKAARVLALSLAGILLTGCGGTSGGTSESSEVTQKSETAVTETDKETEKEAAEPVVLTYMTQQMPYPKEADKINEILHQTYPEITLDIIHVADNYETTVKTKFAAGDAPDLFDWNGYLSNKTFAEAGYFLDITDENINERVMEQFKSSGMYDGRVYGIPTIAQASGLIYNKEAFEKAGIAAPPKTITELKDACEKLKAVGITPIASGFKDVWVAHQMFWNVCGPNVGDFNTWYEEMEAGTASFMNEKTDKTFELIDITIANTVENPLSSDAANMSNKLAVGEAGMCFQGVWQYAEFLKSNPDVELGLAPIPVSDDPEDAVMEYEAQGIVFASSQGEHTEEAKKVLRWFASDDGIKLLGEINGQASPINSDVKVELNPLAADGDTYIKAGGKTVGFIKTFWPSGLTTEVGKQLQNYIAGVSSKTEFFDAIDAAFRKLATGA